MRMSFICSPASNVIFDDEFENSSWRKAQDLVKFFRKIRLASLLENRLRNSVSYPFSILVKL